MGTTIKINRYSAFAIHLALSLLVFGSLIAVMYFYWFPGDLFFMDGGWQGIKLVAMVDLVLGPALTLLLFKPGKPSLVFDLSVVASIQVAALLYGFYTTSTQRIVALVYSDGYFATVTHMENREADAKLQAKNVEPVDLSEFGSKKPVIAFTRPFNVESFGEYLASIANDFPGQRERTDGYLALPAHHQELQEFQLDQEELERLYGFELVKNMLQESGRSLDDNIELYPFRARYQKGIAVFDTDKARIVDILRGKKLELAKSEKQQQRELKLQAESSEDP